MKEWLEKHDAISLHWIEKKIGLKTGSLHNGREIPTRYLELIEKVLMDYGYKYSRGEKEVVVESEIKATGKVYKIGRGLVLKDKNGDFWKTTTDFVDGDEVYISKV
jgi:hypothetical protein